jgi:putative heme-binding domain-containing protein
MMENIIEPSKVISDQYSSTVFKMKDGSEVIGRKGTQEDGIQYLMTNPYSAEYTAEVKVADVVSQKEWHVSPMPPALIYSLNADELSDLIAYIFSAGNPKHEYFTNAKSEGVKQIFNGKDLSGWKGDPKLWKVEDGVIYGSTHGNKLKANTFLVWEEEVEDFHLKWEAKFEGNNSGMMYRAFWKDEDRYRLSGYQCDMHPKPQFVAMLYGEGLVKGKKKRGIIAQRGQKVEIDANEKVHVRGTTTAPEKVDLSQWQTYEVICKGNRMIHKINGKVTVDITDNHPHALKKGLIGMQLHAGKPMKVWFKNIQYKAL